MISMIFIHLIVNWLINCLVPADGDVKRNVRLCGDGLVEHVEVGRHLDNVPGAGLPVVRQVHVVLVVVQGERDLIAGEGPGPKLHDARLLVEREVRHINGAGALKKEKIEIEIGNQNLKTWRGCLSMEFG